MINMTRPDSFTYVRDDGTNEVVDLTVMDAGVVFKTDEIGVHYAPLAGHSNDPIFALIPWNRIVMFFYRP